MGIHLSRTYALRWEEGDLAGVEVDIRSTSVATMREIKSLKVTRDEETLAKMLADHIKRWNLDDENGQPLPISTESVMGLETTVLAAIAREWYLAAAGVSAPLDLGSTSSAPSVEESIPMETL